MGSIGDCFDNAVCEAFDASLKRELINRRPWPTQGRDTQRGLRVHRGLVQPAPTPHHARLPVARAVRADAPRSGGASCGRLSVAGGRSSVGGGGCPLEVRNAALATPVEMMSCGQHPCCPHDFDNPAGCHHSNRRYNCPRRLVTSSPVESTPCPRKRGRPKSRQGA
jgi:hypothetical protein